MAEITNLAQMKTYLLRRLGSPVIQVEIADVQLEQVIEDSVQFFQNWHTGEGNYRDYMGFTIQNGVSAYDMANYDIDSVVDVALSFNDDGINTLFSNTHNLLYNDWVVQRGYPGGPANYGGGAGMELAEYEIATEYLDDIDDMFSRIYSARYHSGKKEMVITPTPTMSGIVLLEVFKRAKAIHLYNNELVKALSLAEAKIQWGQNLRKYAMTLPSGTQINWDGILSEGREDKERLHERIRTEGEPPIFFIE